MAITPATNLSSHLSSQLSTQTSPITNAYESLQSQSTRIILTSKALNYKRNEKPHGHFPIVGTSTIHQPRCSVPQEFRVFHQTTQRKRHHSDAHRGIRTATRAKKRRLWIRSSASKRQIRPSNSLACLAAWLTKSQQIRGTSRYRSKLHRTSRRPQHKPGTDLSTLKTTSWITEGFMRGAHEGQERGKRGHHSHHQRDHITFYIHGP